MSNVNTPSHVLVESRVRSLHTRQQRHSQPGRVRHKQYLFTGSPHMVRLVRGRPLKLRWEVLLEHIEEVKQKAALGVLCVRLLNRALLDLDTLEVVSAPVPAPRPEFPIDSVARDTNQGVAYLQSPGGTAAGDPAARRTAERMAQLKAEEGKRGLAVDETPLEAPVVEVPTATADKVTPEREGTTEVVAAEVKPTTADPVKSRRRERRKKGSW